MKKHLPTIIASLLAFVILVMGGTVLILNRNSTPEHACRFYFQSNISVKDGRVTVGEETETAENVIPFTLSEDPEYHLHLAWEDEDDERSQSDPGFLTLMVLEDNEGEVVAYCSGGWLDNDMELDELKAGEYKAHFRFFVDEKEFRDCLIELGEDISEEAKGSFDGYENFGEEGSWVVNFSFELEGKNGVTYQTGIRLGVLFGGVIGILAALLLILLTKKEKTLKGQYDERQEFYRGRAFKYGFFTMLIYLAIDSCVSVAEIELPMDRAVMAMLGLLLGILVFGSYSIWKDAYFSLNDKKKTTLIIFSLIGLLELLIGISNIRDGSAYVDGQLTYQCISLMVGIMFVILLVVVALKVFTGGKGSAE